MSRFCSRYPDCGCKEIGTKCDLAPDDPRLNRKDVLRNEKGYPLNEDGEIDWELTAKEKTELRDYFENAENSSNRRIEDIWKGKHAKGYTPPKKRRRGINKKNRKNGK